MYNKIKIANSFDENLPKTTTYWKEGRIFFIKNSSFILTKKETQATIDLLMFAMKDKFTKGLVIDNREANGAWPKEIYQLFENHGEFRNEIAKTKIATLTNSALKSGQTDRLSKESGLQETSRTFNSEFNDEVKAFLLS